jgi:dsRNA-specific ribonuclease
LTLLSDNSFANAARRRGLVDYIHISGGLSRLSAFNSTKILATAVEAVLGAIYIDSGNDLDAVMAALVAFGVVPSNDAEAGKFTSSKSAILTIFQI